MKIEIDCHSAVRPEQSQESIERLIRIAFTRYASFLRQVRLHAKKAVTREGNACCSLRLQVSGSALPSIDVEEIQPDVELALQRAIKRVDSILKQYARRRVLAL